MMKKNIGKFVSRLSIILVVFAVLSLGYQLSAHGDVVHPLPVFVPFSLVLFNLIVYTVFRAVVAYNTLTAIVSVLYDDYVQRTAPLNQTTLYEGEVNGD